MSMRIKKIGIILLLTIFCIVILSNAVYATVRKSQSGEYTLIAHIINGKISSVEATEASSQNGGTVLRYSFKKTKKGGEEYWENKTLNLSFSAKTILAWEISKVNENDKSTDFAVNPDDYNTSISFDVDGEVGDIVGKIITVINVVGVIILVAAVMILGIKYMAGSVEQRAEYKKTMMPVLIGAVLLFSLSSILNFVYTTISSIDIDAKESQIKPKSQYDLGKEAAYAWLKTCPDEETWQAECTRASNEARTSRAEWAQGYYEGIKNGPHYWAQKTNGAEQGKYDATQFLKKCPDDDTYNAELTKASTNERNATDSYGKAYWGAYGSTLKSGDKPWRN